MKIMKFFFLIICAFCTGCMSTALSIKYTTSPSSLLANESALPVEVGEVTDSRATRNNWLGVIRAANENPDWDIYTKGRTADVVKVAFEDALLARDMLAPATASEFRIDVDLLRFEASRYVNMEAHAQVHVAVIHIPSGKTIFTQAYRTDSERIGVGDSILGDPKELASFANATLNETIDKALDDPAFLASLSSDHSSKAPLQKP